MGAFVPCHHYLHRVLRTGPDAGAAIVRYGYLPVDLGEPALPFLPLDSGWEGSSWMQLPFLQRPHYWKHSERRRHWLTGYGDGMVGVEFVGLDCYGRNLWCAAAAAAVAGVAARSKTEHSTQRNWRIADGPTVACEGRGCFSASVVGGRTVW